jgi:hypothetical protein
MQAPLYTQASPGTGRGLMADLWQQSLQAYVANDPGYGSRITDDFKLPRTNATDASHNLGWWMENAAAGGTVNSFTSTAGSDGIATLQATTGTDHFGNEIHYGDSVASYVGAVATPLHGTAAARRGRVVYQTRVDMGTTAVGAGPLDQYFIGLTEPIKEFLGATSVLPTTSDYIGFYRFNSGTVKFVVGNDNNGGTAVIDEISIPSGIIVDGFNIFGFAINPVGNGQVSYDVVVNNIWLGALAKTLDPLACPIEYLTPKYAATRGVTGARATVSMPIDSIDLFVAPS